MPISFPQIPPLSAEKRREGLLFWMSMPEVFIFFVTLHTPTATAVANNKYHRQIMYFDTHCHLDGPEFDHDRNLAVVRAIMSDCRGICVPATDLASSRRMRDLYIHYPGYVHTMIGLHPEEVRADWREQLAEIRKLPLDGVVGIGEVGLDFYWSREFESEQLEAFEAQVQWSVESRLPLMIHCRKAQNELVAILRRYKADLPGGVFHCFAGNEREADELLAFPDFAIGVGGVLTFKKSKLPEVLPHIPIERLVLETDSPYMAPVPHRGERNESAFIVHTLAKVAEAYGLPEDEVGRITTENAWQIFNIKH